VRVIEEAGTNGVNLGGLDAPEAGAKFHAVESLPITGDGESRRAAPEEVRCLLQVSEQPAPLNSLRCPDIDVNAGPAITLHLTQHLMLLTQGSASSLSG
jgi:hypothetical protein